MQNHPGSDLVLADCQVCAKRIRSGRKPVCKNHPNLLLANASQSIRTGCESNSACLLGVYCQETVYCRPFLFKDSVTVSLLYSRRWLMFVFYIPGEGTVCLIYTRKGYFLYTLIFTNQQWLPFVLHLVCVSFTWKWCCLYHIP